MPSFSSSEISSMISSKKYKVKKGDDRTSECREGHGCPRATDSLSVLADKFQDAFPCTKSANKNSLMDKIYNMNKSAFGGSKDLLFEGKDLDLKFICEYRNNLKFDKTKSEYTFTDAQRCWIRNSNRLKPQDFLKDKLADQTFAFWDDFIKFDRSIGESMKQTFRNSPSSSLPKSLPLPITPKSSSNNKKLMEEIKKNLSGQMITTNQIAEAFLKMTGSSYSSGQVRDLAVRLEKENGACRCNTNAPCSVPRDKLEQIDCKCLEESYCCMPLSSSEKSKVNRNKIYKMNKIDCAVTSIKELKERFVK